MLTGKTIVYVLVTTLLISFCFASPTSRETRSSDEEQIVKSASDDNEYRAVTLSNKIRCVLVSDTSTEIAAVEIRVASGYLAEDTPGLAHFVEHMLFEGSPEYSDGNHYQSFVQENGGNFNGATWESATTYIFKIRNEYWVQTAKILASFVGNPLFPKEKFASAIQAVDSEYKINIRSDYRSLYAVAMKLNNPENRYREFSTGSKETLNVTDIYAQSLEFYDQFYSANLMTIAIVANDTLDSLELLAEETFGNIPNKNRKKPQNTALPFPTSDKRYLGKKVYFKMKRKVDQLTFLFPINLANYVNVDYIIYLLDHEGSGSIYQYLLSRGYATAFGSFVLLEDSQTVPLAVYCQPTEKGIADPYFIVETVFKYLKAACTNGVDGELWESVKQINELNFRFQEKEEGESLVSSILDRMGASNVTQKYLGAPSQLSLDVEVENKILGFFHPDNFNLYVGSDSFSDTEATSNGPRLTEHEYFYSTPYLATNFTEEQLQAWRNVETDPELHLPQPNTFVPNNFEIFDIEDDAGQLPTEIVSRDEADMSIWWLQDQEWMQPKLYTGCKIFPSQVTRNARTWALESMVGDIYGLVKNLALYEAWEADFNPMVDFDENWYIVVFGHSDPKKVENVLSKMLDVLFNLDFTVDDALFKSNVVLPVQEHYDEDHEGPYHFAYKYIDSIVFKEFVDWTDVKKAAGEISQLDVKEYMTNFLAEISLSCSTFGNVGKEHAIRYSNIIKEKLVEHGSKIQNEDRRSLTDQKINQIPSGPSHVIRRSMENPDQMNSATLVMFQIGRVEADGGLEGSPPYTVIAFTGLLELIMGQSCFSYLRTEKQLGYMAFCYSRTSNGITNFFFGVQGSRPGAGPDVVDREINNLIAQQHDTYRLLALGPEGELKFEEVKEALSNTVSIKPRTLWDKSQKLTEEIYSSTRDFDRVDKLLAAIKSMTAKNFLELYEKFIVGDTKRKISSQVYGSSHVMPDTIEEGEILVEDVEAFREHLTFF